MMLANFFKDERGATAIEYGLIAALMFVACITAFHAFGDSANTMFKKISTAVTAATS